jgi:hypothetical protein
MLQITKPDKRHFPFLQHKALIRQRLDSTFCSLSNTQSCPTRGRSPPERSLRLARRSKLCPSLRSRQITKKYSISIFFAKILPIGEVQVSIFLS